MNERKETLISYTASIIKQPVYLKAFILGAAIFGILYTFLYGLWRIPFIDFGIDRMSSVGIIDYSYLIIVSVFTGLLVSLYKFDKTNNTKTTKAGIGGGFVAAVFAGVCPACQGINILAVGTTVASLPLAFLVPYIGLIQILTIFILGLAFMLKANTIYTKTCITCNATNSVASEGSTQPNKKSGKGHFLYENNIAFIFIIVLVLLLVVNNFMITTAFAAARSGGSNLGSITLKPGFEYGSKVTLKPMPLASDETPRFSGYKSIVKPLPTISEMSISPSTGDVVQDLVNNVVPHGTPWYGPEAGVSFDDPITAQNLWKKGRAIELNADQQKRYDRIVNSFTCDYCCGSPQQPTIITRCGCAHAYAAQGMAKWFIKNYGDKYSDEEIYGEMARWYALWYPGPTVKRIAQELQAAN